MLDGKITSISFYARYFLTRNRLSQGWNIWNPPPFQRQRSDVYGRRRYECCLHLGTASSGNVQILVVYEALCFMCHLPSSHFTQIASVKGSSAALAALCCSVSQGSRASVQCTGLTLSLKEVLQIVFLRSQTHVTSHKHVFYFTSEFHILSKQRQVTSDSCQIK
jgi:hypothetical protein